MPVPSAKAVTPAPSAVGPAITTKPATGGEDDYAEILKLSYLFYEGQMSGKLPEWNRCVGVVVGVCVSA